MRIGIVVIVLGCLAVTAPASSQTVYKCRDHKGQPVYQSFPCGGDLQPEKTWHSEIRQPSNREQWDRYHAEQKIERARQAVKAHNAARRGDPVYRVAPSGLTRSQKRDAACEAAKAHRKVVLDQVGLKRTFDLLRALDDKVYAACK